MNEFIGLTIAGASLGAIYAIAASGLVVTYTTSGVFNFAHGAVGMFMAFVYWQLRVHLHWAGPFAVGACLLIAAPLIGIVIERALIRRLNINDVGMTLVTTVAVMVAFMGIAFTVWPQNVGRSLNTLFGPSRYVTFYGSRIQYSEFLSIGIAIAVAVGLRLFFFRNRYGIAMRASVDDRALVGLNGVEPGLLSSLSWVIGITLGALGGILTATTTALDVVNLTLLVLNAFAAAMLGRLKNLPLTFAGAMVLGLADAYVTGYVNLSGWLANLKPVLPTLFLFVVLLALPSVRIRAGTQPVLKRAPVPSARRSLVNGALLVGAALIAAPLMHGTVLSDVDGGVALAIGALSIVLLSGYGGQISLCQYSFFGVGAWIFSKFHGDPLGLLVAALVGAVLGAIVAFPAMRLRGLELALSTLAFGELVYYMFFLQPSVIGNGDLTIERLHIPGISLANDRANLVAMIVVFGVVSACILAVRRGPFGRLLNATKDSQAACATLGINLRFTKVALFAAATAVATFGGALYGSTQEIVTSNSFQYVSSLFIVLIVYIWGVSTPGSALAGTLSLAVAPLIALHVPTRYQAVSYFLTGFGALGLAMHPEGVIPMASERIRGLATSRRILSPKPYGRVEDADAAVAGA